MSPPLEHQCEDGRFGDESFQNRCFVKDHFSAKSFNVKLNADLTSTISFIISIALSNDNTF